MQELWELLTSAQETIGGIPTKFLEQKKEEIRQKKVEFEQRGCRLRGRERGRKEWREEEGERGREGEERERESGL